MVPTKVQPCRSRFPVTSGVPPKAVRCTTLPAVLHVPNSPDCPYPGSPVGMPCASLPRPPTQRSVAPTLPAVLGEHLGLEPALGALARCRPVYASASNDCHHRRVVCQGSVLPNLPASATVIVSPRGAFIVLQPVRTGTSSLRSGGATPRVYGSPLRGLLPPLSSGWKTGLSPGFRRSPPRGSYLPSTPLRTPAS